MIVAVHCSVQQILGQPSDELWEDFSLLFFINVQPDSEAPCSDFKRSAVSVALIVTRLDC